MWASCGAGKAVYPLPMDVTPLCATRSILPSRRARSSGAYESGGRTDNVLPIWESAAPAIDILAPDDYQGDPPAYVKELNSIAATTIPYSCRERLFQCDRPSGDFYPLFFTMLGLGR